MNDFAQMAQLYEAFIGDKTQKFGPGMRGQSSGYDRKHSFTAGGINNPGFVDNQYALNLGTNNSAIEDEEGECCLTAQAFKDFSEELRGRGYDKIANELALLIKKFF